MSRIPNVVKRGGVYHFRRVIPFDLRPVLARTELVRTLATGDRQAAKLSALELYVRSEQLFSSLRSHQMLTQDQLARLVHDFYAHVLERENQARLTGGPIPDEARRLRAAYYATIAANSKEALACNCLEEAALVTEGMLCKQGIAPAELSKLDLAQARQALLRAGIDLAEAVKARYEGDFNHEPLDQSLKRKVDEFPREPEAASEAPKPPAASAPVAFGPAPAPTSDGPLLSKVGAAFRESQVATGAWDHQTANQAKATFRLFVDVCGAKPLLAYTRRDAGLFRDRIQRLPNDYGKHPRYRDLSVDAILAAHVVCSLRSGPS